jgi:transmembrane sensor
MSDPEGIPGAEGQLLQEAAAWFARMRGPQADESRAEFDAWLARGALHRAAYNRAAEIFAMGKLLNDDEPTTKPSEDGDKRRARFTLALLGGALALVAGTLVALNQSQRQDGRAHQVAESSDGRGHTVGTLSTGAGESQTVRLADGTRVSLASGTRLTLGFSASVRRLALEQGQARFEVARDRRPFVVLAGGGRVTALGTIFDVGIQADRRVTVRLVEGLVEVTPPSIAKSSASASRPRRLSPGQTLTFNGDGTVVADSQTRRAANPLPNSAPAISDSITDFESITIDELVAIANRAAARPIRLEAPGLGQRQLSGRFRVDDTAVLAERIALLFDLKIQQATTEIVLSPR